MFPVSVKVPNEVILSLLCCAFEGGSNYWYSNVEEKHAPPVATTFDHIESHFSQRWPVLGGSVTVTELDPDDGTCKKHLLTKGKLAKGLALMADVQPLHFADALNGDDDAITGDVFLQLCLFGKIVYG